MPIPLARPRPPQLSQAVPLLQGIEQRGVFTNFGPVNSAFEADLLNRLFADRGACSTVCNATIGLMLAIKQALRGQSAARRFALMPSFTFAAAAQAAMWCGLTPLFCDIGPSDWCADADAEAAMLRCYAGEIAVVMPYAAFGYDMDLSRYEHLSKVHDVPVVVDAAASLGTVRPDGCNFGTGFSGTVVFSMHATKSFATAEGGLLYSGNPATVRDLRSMSNFGFGRPRVATMPGLNAKLSEVGALLGQLRLDGFDTVMDHRGALMQRYRRALPGLTFQREQQGRQAHQFVPALLPSHLAPHRQAIQDAVLTDGIGTATYFSPHLAEQDYFLDNAVSGLLPVTTDVASRIISLPLYDAMTVAELEAVAASVQQHVARFAPLMPGMDHLVPAVASKRSRRASRLRQITVTRAS